MIFAAARAGPGTSRTGAGLFR